MNHPKPGTTDPISSFLGSVALAPRQSSKSLTLWPLISRGSGPPRGAAYTTLGAAFAKGRLRIDELDEGGAVPHVRVLNEGDVAVLFLFGEEIRGAKQNRVANASFLVPAKSEIVIDVSCVEAGRWNRRQGARFEATDAVLSHSLRRGMAHRVAESLAVGDGFLADQGEVWDGIEERITRSRVRSSTGAYADYRESRKSDLESLLEAFGPVDGQVGFVASIGDEVVGLEAIGRPDVFAASYHPLLRSYAIDAIDASLVRGLDAKQSRPRFDSPEVFLQALGQLGWARSPSLGLGDDLRVRGRRRVAGCALVEEDVVHITAFPAVA